MVTSEGIQGVGDVATVDLICRRCNRYVAQIYIYTPRMDWCEAY